MNLNFNYDNAADVLYASLGNPRPATSLSKGNGIIIRIDPDTKEVIGFTVLDYMKRRKMGALKPVPNFENVILPEYN